MDNREWCLHIDIFPTNLLRWPNLQKKEGGHLNINDSDSVLTEADRNKIGWNPFVEVVKEPRHKIKTEVDVGRKIDPSTIDPGPFAIGCFCVSVILLFFIAIPLIGYSTGKTNNWMFKGMLIFGIVILTLVFFANITHWLNKNWDDNKCFAIGIVVAVVEIFFLYMCL